MVGGLARRMLDAPGLPRPSSTLTDELDRALDGADFVLVQIRVGGQEARLRDETVPLACGCIGQETTGAGGLAKALPHGAGRARDRRACARARRRRRLDRRLHEPGRDRHARAARRRPPRGRPLQRRDRLPALVRAAARRRAGGASWSTRSGLNHLTWVRAVRVDGEDVLPAAARRARRRARRAGRGLPRAAARASSASSRPTTSRYFYAHDRVLAEQLGERAARRAWSQEIERELLELYRDPELTEKPALLEQRGGAYYSEAAVGLVALARDRRRRRARGRRAERGHARRASPTTTWSRCRRASARDSIEPLPQAPLAPELLGLTQHVAAYERLAAQAAVSRDPATARKALARASADRPVRARRRAARAAARAAGGTGMSGARARRGRRRVEDRTSRSSAPTAALLAARSAGRESSPQNLGLEGALARARRLLERARLAARRRRPGRGRRS